MSSARRARAAALAVRKALGTYVPVAPRKQQVRHAIASAARITRDRESAFFEATDPVDLVTSIRKPSADSHHVSLDLTTPWHPVSPDNTPDSF